MGPLIGWSETKYMLFKFQGGRPFLSEVVKGLKGDVTVTFRGTMWGELVFVKGTELQFSCFLQRARECTRGFSCSGLQGLQCGCLL